MSVYAEFHKAWRTRFPGKELPGAWEEDVRANLAKHRARAAVLREDLEKEQFYVEYLERLVEDVQQHSNRGGGEVRGEGEGAATPYTCMPDHVDEAINSVIAEHSTSAAESATEEEKPFGSVKNLTRRFNKNTNSRSTRPPGFLRSTSVPATSTTTGLNSTASHRLSGCDPSAFITVIPISGEGGEVLAAGGGKTRKPPPVVPPKNFRQRPPSLGDPPEPRPPAPLPHQCLSPTVMAAEGGRLYKSASSSSSGSDRSALILSKIAATDGGVGGLSRRSSTPPALQSDQSDEEPLYDTVAPDEEEDSPFDTLKSGGSGGSLASKSGCSGGALSSPSGSPAPTDFPSMESPKHCNYVNLDFFLKRLVVYNSTNMLTNNLLRELICIMNRRDNCPSTNYFNFVIIINWNKINYIIIKV